VHPVQWLYKEPREAYEHGRLPEVLQQDEERGKGLRSFDEGVEEKRQAMNKDKLHQWFAEHDIKSVSPHVTLSLLEVVKDLRLEMITAKDGDLFRDWKRTGMLYLLCAGPQLCTRKL